MLTCNNVDCEKRGRGCSHVTMMIMKREKGRKKEKNGEREEGEGGQRKKGERGWREREGPREMLQCRVWSDFRRDDHIFQSQHASLSHFLPCIVQ